VNNVFVGILYKFVDYPIPNKNTKKCAMNKNVFTVSKQEISWLHKCTATHRHNSEAEYSPFLIFAITFSQNIKDSVFNIKRLFFTLPMFWYQIRHDFTNISDKKFQSRDLSLWGKSFMCSDLIWFDLLILARYRIIKDHKLHHTFVVKNTFLGKCIFLVKKTFLEKCTFSFTLAAAVRLIYVKAKIITNI